MTRGYSTILNEILQFHFEEAILKVFKITISRPFKLTFKTENNTWMSGIRGVPSQARPASLLVALLRCNYY